MRTKIPVIAAALLIASAGARAQGPADAPPEPPQQTTTSPAPTASPALASEFGLVNQIDFGVRGTNIGPNSDPARFQRYDDLRDGATIDRFRFSKETQTYGLKLQADNVGYRDERFSASYNRFGRLKAAFEWNQIPLFYSTDTRTLYSSTQPGVLTLPDVVQAGRQTNAITLAQAAQGVSWFDMRSKRNIADFNLTYSASNEVDLKVGVKNTNRDGSQPFGAGFGFTQAIEVAMPIDTRTTEFTSAAEWSNGDAFGKLAYEGSFFRNGIRTLVWDNPNRLTDSPTAPGQGRMALWPDSDLNTVSATGSIKLPWRSRAAAYVSYGDSRQNDSLIPLTINSQINAGPLPRSTADADAHITAQNYSFTSRPINQLYFSARYRQYQYDNRTPAFTTTVVNYDSALGALATTEAHGYTRHTFDADASYSPIRYFGVRAGYTREQYDRTFRFVESTAEDIYRASADATGISWLTVRGVYEHAKRWSTSVDREMLVEVGEQPTIGHYDISDRTRDRFSGILTVLPVSTFSITATTGLAKNDYPTSQFGLQNTENHFYSIGVDYSPTDKVSAGLSYGYERNDALQASRQPSRTVPATFVDPRYDWTDSSADRTNTVDASLDLLKVIPKTELRVGYNYTLGKSSYNYALGPNSLLVTPAPLPELRSDIQRGTVDGRYFLTSRFAIGALYWYDKYLVNDFAMGPQIYSTGVSLPSFLALGYQYRPYVANSLMARVTYLW